jgi:hypothetical protein
MPTLHNPATRDSIITRLRTLRATSAGKWGEMSVDQMLWHCNQALEQCLGHITPGPTPAPPLPKSVVKFLVLNVPWPKGAPTNPDFIARAQHDFDAELARSVRLVEEMALRSLESTWPENNAFGPMSGTEWSRLMAKHLDHHLRQFGA